MVSPRGRERSHILEWSDEAEQEVEEDGITLRVRAPSRTYGGVRKSDGGQWGRGAGSSDSDEVGGGEEAGGSLGGRVTGEGLMLNDTLGFLQGEQSGSEDGDPGGLVTGSAPWEEEKVGPCAAGWMEPWRVGGTVRAKAIAQRRQTGLGVAPTGWLKHVVSATYLRKLKDTYHECSRSSLI
ncbi:hypothetical protein NDU88_001677 [Pleurodeles waltl]|uniref:Uncharacterized protein n=1 Tax=Pleurodeles waltl TaxID=8319 RepID=A0AAV7MKG2_PLEWA|nr:hypothetical protein NDU88_001677 [Pleurodeles waltl]